MTKKFLHIHELFLHHIFNFFLLLPSAGFISEYCFLNLAAKSWIVTITIHTMIKQEFKNCTNTQTITLTLQRHNFSQQFRIFVNSNFSFPQWQGKKSLHEKDQSDRAEYLFQCNRIGNTTEGDIARLNNICWTNTLPCSLRHELATLCHNSHNSKKQSQTFITSAVHW